MDKDIIIALLLIGFVSCFVFPILAMLGFFDRNTDKDKDDFDSYKHQIEVENNVHGLTNREIKLHRNYMHILGFLAFLLVISLITCVIKLTLAYFIGGVIICSCVFALVIMIIHFDNEVLHQKSI